MRVRVKYSAPQMSVDEVFSGGTADDVVRAMQQAVAARLNFLMKPIVLHMSPAQFGQEVVRRYNQASGRAVPTPQSAQEFLTLGQAEGIVTVLEA
jgi:hypothetical protein